MPRRQIDRLAAPFHGGRVVRPPNAVHEFAAALGPLMRADQCFGGLTAAALQGMRMPEGVPTMPLHVITFEGGRAMRRRGVRGRSSSRPIDCVEAAPGIRVTDPIRTWCDLGDELEVDELIGIADGLVRRRDPVATIPQLVAAVDALPESARRRRLREAVAEVRGGTDSWRETMLRLVLVRAGLPEPEVNGPVRLRSGTVLHGDLVWRASKTIVEYEGRQHWEDPGQFAIDLRRIDALLDDGWDHVRVDKLLLANERSLIQRVERSLARPRHE